MKEIEERLNHIGELVKGLSEQNSGNMTILNSNCQMLGNRLEDLEKKVQDLEDFNTPAEQKLELLRNQIDRVDKKVRELETKTASDLPQKVVAESETSEEQDCLWLARSKSGRLYSFTEKPQISSNGEHWNGRNILFWGTSKYKSLTYENSPQKLVLESSAISKKEAAEEGYEPTIDDCFYNREKENSEKPDLQDAFTELRALIEKYENFLEEVELKNTAFAEIILKEIREVIE
jgi:prefoldin subunit 5